jgi:acyl carrier protein
VTTAVCPSGTLEDAIRRVVADVLRVPVELVASEAPFAELGMDSLAAVELATAIEDALEVDLPMSAVYEHSTVAELTEFLQQGSGPRESVSVRSRMRADAMLPAEIIPDLKVAARPTRDARRVLVTGATGFVGAFLVRTIADETSADICCLVRDSGADARSRLRNRLESLGLWSDDLDQRIDIVVGDLSLPYLGLLDSTFATLAGAVDAIYHAGADVDWVRGYDALRATNVLGTVELLRLACTGSPKPFHFVSSVSVCHSTTAPRDVDETLDPIRTIDGLWLGYAQSKCVAEALVRDAGARGLPVTILRPSLVSGATASGRSNPDDLVSRFIAGCIAMRAAPDLDWRVDCVPVDDVAKSIVRLSRAHEAGVAISHLTATAPKHWRECVLWMRLSGYDIELVAYREWVAMLVESGERNPLHPLRAFFARTIPAEDNLTLPELFEESRRPRVANARTRAALASLGHAPRPLTARTLSRYFEDFERVSLIPRIAARTRATDRDAEFPSLDAIRVQIEASLSRTLRDDTIQIGAIELTAINTDESIVAELTAWRGGTSSGLFEADVAFTSSKSAPQTKRLFIKSKPADAEVIDVAEAVAALASPALGETVSRFRDHLGFTRAHHREIALYADADVRLRRHTPLVYATRSTDRDRQWLVVLESLDAVNYESVSVREASTSPQIDAVIAGLARIHAVGFERRAELEEAPWQAPRRTHSLRGAMIPLWSALATHALKRSTPWSDRRLRLAHERAIMNLSKWSHALESGGQTLIHNDFNPRNFVLRRLPGGLELCAFDWEFATMGLPQRDLVECLAFMLPENASRAAIASRVEQHRLALERESGIELGHEEWEHGFRAALCDFLVDRLASYAMVDRVRRQAFLPRVARGWLNLYQHYQPE